MSRLVGVLVQMRMGSTRLPGKALLELAGLPMARHVMRALALVPAEVHAVLTDEASRDVLAPHARAEGFELFVGPAEDVLRRYTLAAERFGVTTVIRATGDAPLVSPRLAREILARHQAEAADLSHFLGSPLGTGVEVVETEALREADRAARRPDEREHVTRYLYSNRERFRVLEPQCPPECRLAERDVSVDTAEDYELAKRIFGALYDGAPIEADRLVRWLRTGAA